MRLTLKEQRILWSVLNNAQHNGLISVGKLLSVYAEAQPLARKLLNDWIKQTVEEYDIINNLKVKLCGEKK